MTAKQVIRDTNSEPFWDAAASGRLLIQRCVTSGRFQWYPRPHSLHASGGQLEWVEASGIGCVFSFTIMYRGPGPAAAKLHRPRVVALIELEEGPIVLAEIQEADPTKIAVGMKVQVRFIQNGSGPSFPAFAPMG
jgi:uncharacterized OB-fold protein